MGEMTIRLKDEKLIERLTDMAKQHNRTVESEIADILGNAVGGLADFDPLKEAKRIAAKTPRGQTQTDSTLLVRQDRNR